ncbi:hypothetical protein H7K45_12685 [Mycobacterium yunnanensis]|uniref:Uncharacterized protein n=1 Tax=Mycobacterium yunnanensis TaxID=368477 RepID=A0A9X3BTQ5_9MYCO|nr:hypothetical protein [Mycobacterium yunnanensis]MCV7421400.1 hypothetical protein [Mycobacterium yunnanensis]
MRDEIQMRVADETSDAGLIIGVANELSLRLKRSGKALPPRTRSRHYKRPHQSLQAPIVFTREAHPIEMLIVMTLARTSGAAQFGFSPSGEVFTADTDGWSLPSGRRNDVTGLSPLLDEAAALFNEWRRDGRGGRFYARDGVFFDAQDGAVFLRIRECNDACDFDGQMGRHWRDAVVDLDGTAGPNTGRVARESHRPDDRNLLQKILGIFGR